MAMFVSQGLGGPKGNGKSSYSKGKQVNIPVQHNFTATFMFILSTLRDTPCRIIVLFKLSKLGENCNSENLVYLLIVIRFIE